MRFAKPVFGLSRDRVVGVALGDLLEGLCRCFVVAAEEMVVTLIVERQSPGLPGTIRPADRSWSTDGAGDVSVVPATEPALVIIGIGGAPRRPIRSNVARRVLVVGEKALRHLLSGSRQERRILRSRRRQGLRRRTAIAAPLKRGELLGHQFQLAGQRPDLRLQRIDTCREGTGPAETRRRRRRASRAAFMRERHAWA